jgi:hypothetical protein
MIWASKLVHQDEVKSVEMLFRDQTASFDAEQQMLLVSVLQDWPKVRLWVAVADEALLTPYYGFAPCRRNELPVAPTLIAGSSTHFERVFQNF